MRLSKGHRRLLRALAITMGIGIAVPAAQASPLTGEPERYYVFDGRKVALELAEGYTAIEYQRDLEGPDNLERAKSHAKALGTEIVQDKAGINQVIVKTDRKTMQAKIAGKADIAKSVKTLRPVFFLEGNPSPEAMVVIPDRLVISFDDSAGIDERNAIAKMYGLRPFMTLMNNTYSYWTDADGTEIPGLAVRIAEENPGVVKWSEPVFDREIKKFGSTALTAGDDVVDSEAKTGADPFWNDQWHLFNAGTNTTPLVPGDPDEDVDAMRFWNPNTRIGVLGDGRTRGYYGDKSTGTSVIVAVLDTGTNLDHEDWETNRTDPNNPPNFSRTVLDPDIGFDYVQADPVPDARLEGHGTSVAGIIAAARNNGRGVVGVAPSAKIYTLRVFDDLGGAVSSDLFAAAIVDSVNHLAEIGNHSYGGISGTTVEEEAFQFAFESGRFGLGMANFVATGNDTTYQSYPSLYDWNFAVGGVDDRGDRVDYASYSGKIDFVGPTQQSGRAGIVTTDIMGSAGYSGPDPLNPLDPFGNYTDSFNGTSAATPVITGVAALVLSEFPTIPIQPYQTGSVYGWQTNLLELMALTADRPPDQHMYFPGVNNAAYVVYDRLVPDADAPATETVGISFGNPAGFRRNQGYLTDGFSHYFGYGRPNPFNVATVQAAPSPYRDYIQPEPQDYETRDFGEMFLAYASDFGADYEIIYQRCLEDLTGEDGEEPDPEDLLECIRSRTDLFNDWTFDIVRVAEDCEGDEFALPEMGYASPYDELGTFQHVFEFGPTVSMSRVSITNGEESYNFIEGNVFPYVIAQAIPYAGEDNNDSFAYNPRGRYLAGRTYNVRSNMTPTGSLILTPPDGADEDFDWSGVPLILEITLKHDLGIYNGSAGGENSSLSRENDTITIQAGGTTIATITGSSHNLPIFPVLPSSGEEEVDCEQFPSNTFISTWPIAGYIPSHESTELLWRTYRFPIPARTDGAISIRITASSGSSYLPEWDYSQETPEQILDIAKRDNRGFQIGDIKIWGVDPNPDPNTTLDGTDIADPPAELIAERGTLPVWSPSGREVEYVRQDEFEPSVHSRVMTAYSDGLFRVMNETLGVPSVAGRNSVPLLRACMELEPGLNDCTPTRILSLASDVKTSRLMYVIDAPAGLPRIFTATDDGFDEQPLFAYDPASTTPRPDANATEAIFGRSTNVVLFTDGTTINSCRKDGTLVRFVTDTSVHKVTNLRHLSLDDSEQIVSYTGTQRDGTDDIFFTIRGINSSGVLGFYREMVAWPNSSEREGQFSPDGKRFAFVSNALTPGGGTTPPAGAPFKLYVIDNAQDIVTYGSGSATVAPRYAGEQADFSLPMYRDNRLVAQPVPANPTYVSAAYPRFSPDGSKLLMVGFLETNRDLGEITTLRLPARKVADEPVATNTPAPTDSPTPTPYPTETPEPTDNIVRTAHYSFDTAGDGWSYGSSPIFNQPTHSTASGSLELTATENTNTYGSFVSPAAALRMYPYDILGTDADAFNAGLTIDPPLEEREGPLYLLRYYLRRTNIPAAEAATLRMRVNSETFEDYHLLVLNSLGSLSRIPDATVSTPVDMLFQPNPWMYGLESSKQSYRLAFDIINADPTDSASAGYILDRVDIFRVPPVQVEELGTFKSYEFEGTDVNDWLTYEFPDQFTPPIFSTSTGRLELAAPSPPTSVFGTWQNAAGTIGVDASPHAGAVFIEMTARAGAEDPNPFKVPEMRFRLAEDSFQAVAITGVTEVKGFGTGKLIPTQGNERLYRAYLKVSDDVVSQTGLHAAWDILSFEDLAGETDPNYVDSTEKVYLDSLDLSLIRVNNYPAVSTTP
ncbi:MAG: thermitase [Candidatus Sumerlaeota bacterium]|nr:thermitase [Candidatus Sumerlaeota bacterium]